MGWQGWNKMPTGSTQRSLAVAGSVNIFGRGNDRFVYHSGSSTGQFPTTYSAWQVLGGLTTPEGPAATIHAGSVYVFAVNDNGRISYTRWNGAGADGWHEIPGSETPNKPSVASGVMVVRRGNNSLSYNTFDGAGSTLSWGSWRDIAGLTPSAPSITEFGNGYLMVVRGTNNGLHYTDLNASRTSWGAWRGVPGGGVTFDAPAVAKSLLVVRGTDDALHWNTFDGGTTWTGWNSAQGKTFSAPALAHSGSYSTLVVRGSDDGIHYAYYQ